MSNLVFFMILVLRATTSWRGRLAPAPPHRNSGENHNERQQELAGYANPAHLRTGQGDAAVFGLFGGNGDQVLVGRKPIHGIQGPIAIAVESDEGIGSPWGADDKHASALRTFSHGVVSTASRHGHQALFCYPSGERKLP